MTAMSRSTSKWTESEDERLKQLVEELGHKQWTLIASRLGTRAGKQCRERWKNHLDPEISHEAFTAEEDERIVELVQEMGTRWAELSKLMKGRSENAIKNRYYSTLIKSKSSKSSKKPKAKAKASKTKAKPQPSWPYKLDNVRNHLNESFEAQNLANSPQKTSSSPQSVPSPSKLSLKGDPSRRPASSLFPHKVQRKDLFMKLMYAKRIHAVRQQHPQTRTRPPLSHSEILKKFLPLIHSPQMDCSSQSSDWTSLVKEDLEAAASLLHLQWNSALSQHPIPLNALHDNPSVQCSEDEMQSDRESTSSDVAPQKLLLPVADVVQCTPLKQAKSDGIFEIKEQPLDQLHHWTDLLDMKKVEEH